MSASKEPTMLKMAGYMIQGELYVREADCRRNVQTAMAMNGNNILLGALRSIIAHWDEFGPAHGFDETLDRARKILESDKR